MPTVTLSNGKHFEAGREQTLLEAARSAGLVLEHSCRTGRCGTCSTRLEHGEVEPVGDQSGLSGADRQNGHVLTCGSRARTDLRLATEDVGAAAAFPSRLAPCRIDALSRLAPDVMKVTLRLPPA